MQGKKPLKKKRQTLSKSKSKSKGKHRRMNTFNSSEFSMLEERMEKNYASASVCDLFRHETVKNSRAHNASVCVYSSQPNKKRAEKGAVSLAVRHPAIELGRNKLNKNKTKPRLKKQQQSYERIPLNCSNSGSQLIVFSNEDTQRESKHHFGDKLQSNLITMQDVYSIGKGKNPKIKSNSSNAPIQSHSKSAFQKEAKGRNYQGKPRQGKSKQFLTVQSSDSQQQLRHSVKKEYQRKVDAATKIQKVFRGHLTRKILIRYILQEQQKLHKQKNSLKKATAQHSIDYEEFDEQSNHSNHRNSTQTGNKKLRGILKNPYNAYCQSSLIDVSPSDLNSSKGNSHNTFQDVSRNQFQISQFENLDTKDNRFLKDEDKSGKVDMDDDSDSDYLSELQDSGKLVPQEFQETAWNYPYQPQSHVFNTHVEQGKQKTLGQRKQSRGVDDYIYEDDDEEDPTPLVTRHPMIYSRQDLHQFLDQNTDPEDYDEYADEDLNAPLYQPNVIFQTNQEYLQSRKSSLQNRNSTKNQLAVGRTSHSHSQEHPIGIRNTHLYDRQFDQEPLKRGSMEVEKNSVKKKQRGYQQQQQPSDKKYSYQLKKSKQSFQNHEFLKDAVMPTKPSQQFAQEHKQREELPVTNPSEVSRTQQSLETGYHLTFNSEEDRQPFTQTYSFPKIDKQSAKDIQSQSHERNKKLGMVRGRGTLESQGEVIEYAFLKKSREASNSCSSSSLQKPFEDTRVQKLKQSERDRWEQISQMISVQVHQNELKNQEMNQFMNNIIKLCKRNKQLLSYEESLDVQHTTPTTTIDAQRIEQFQDSSSTYEKEQYETINHENRQHDIRRKERSKQRNYSKTPKQQQNLLQVKTGQFRKKNNLQIEIVEDGGHQERLSISKPKQSMEKVFKKDPVIRQVTVQSGMSPRNLPLPLSLPSVSKTHPTLSSRRKSKEDLAQLVKQNNKVNFQEQNISEEKHYHQPSKSSVQDSLQRSEYQQHASLSAIRNGTYKLKNFLTQNLQNQSLEQMLVVREQLLQKRESQILLKLHQQLSRGKLTQDEFIKRLSELTKRFEQEKVSIDKAKTDIERGYQAAMGLVKQTYKDAKKLGVKVNLCRSLGSMKLKDIRFLQNVVVDQFHCYTPNNKNTRQQFKTEQQKCSSEKQEKREEQIINAGEKGQSSVSQRSNRRKIELVEDSSDSSQVDFTEEELERFRKIQPYDSQFMEMNKNITISDDFLKLHLKQSQAQPRSSKSNKVPPLKSDSVSLESLKRDYELEDSFKLSESEHTVKPSSEAHREVYEVDIDDYPHPLKSLTQPHSLKDRISELQFEKLIYEAAIEILQKPILNEKLIDRTYLSKPQPIRKQEQQLFIEILEQNFPPESLILKKLNQKISPLPTQLLKCMRIDFSEENQIDDTVEMEGYNQDNDYEEIGKYEFIIGQEVCAQALTEFRNKIETNSLSSIYKSSATNNLGFPLIQEASAEEEINKSQLTFDDINGELNFEPRIVRYMSQRQRFISNRKKHTKGLRWEILNIEVHSIFDAWNQQLIQLRTHKAGYSGIGLNQLTLSTIDQNKPLMLHQVRPLLGQGKQQLLAILQDTSQLNEKMLKQNFQEMCNTDSTWIYYADEALSYGLELHYLVEEEIFMECAREIINKFHGIDTLYLGHMRDWSESDQYDSYALRGIQDEPIDNLDTLDLKSNSHS